jgi:hypothetical protein
MRNLYFMLRPSSVYESYQPRAEMASKQFCKSAVPLRVTGITTTSGTLIGSDTRHCHHGTRRPRTDCLKWAHSAMSVCIPASTQTISISFGNTGAAVKAAMRIQFRFVTVRSSTESALHEIRCNTNSLSIRQGRRH